LWVAEAGAFSPAWSETIHTEWMRNRRDKFGDPISRLQFTRTEMETAFPGANFDPDTEISKSISLPDMDDVHVVATAIAAQAKTIVTYNERHFPNRALAPLGLRTESPDAFCARLFSEAPANVIEGARNHRASLKNPSYDRGPYLNHLGSLDLTRTTDLLRASETLL
jgi:hypothetical protein